MITITRENFRLIQSLHSVPAKGRWDVELAVDCGNTLPRRRLHVLLHLLCWSKKLKVELSWEGKERK